MITKENVFRWLTAGRASLEQSIFPVPAYLQHLLKEHSAALFLRVNIRLGATASHIASFIVSRSDSGEVAQNE